MPSPLPGPTPNPSCIEGDKVPPGLRKSLDLTSLLQLAVSGCYGLTPTGTQRQWLTSTRHCGRLRTFSGRPNRFLKPAYLDSGRRLKSRPWQGDRWYSRAARIWKQFQLKFEGWTLSLHTIKKYGEFVPPGFGKPVKQRRKARAVLIPKRNRRSGFQGELPDRLLQIKRGIAYQSPEFPVRSFHTIRHNRSDSPRSIT
jgi:hypothetical protein